MVCFWSDWLTDWLMDGRDKLLLAMIDWYRGDGCCSYCMLVFWRHADVHAIDPVAKSCQGRRGRGKSRIYAGPVQENIPISHFPSLSWEVESWMWWVVLGIRPNCHRGVDGRADWRADGGQQGGLSCCKGLLLRLGGGRRRVGALAGAAAGLCAGTGLFHLSSLCQRGLVHCLQPETFTLTFVKCLKPK